MSTRLKHARTSAVENTTLRRRSRLHEPPGPVFQRVRTDPLSDRQEVRMATKQELLQQAEQEYDGLKASAELAGFMRG